MFFLNNFLILSKCVYESINTLKLVANFLCIKMASKTICSILKNWEIPKDTNLYFSKHDPLGYRLIHFKSFWSSFASKFATWCEQQITTLSITKCHEPNDSKCPFHPLVGGRSTPLKGHLTIQKRSRRIAENICYFFFASWFHDIASGVSSSTTKRDLYPPQRPRSWNQSLWGPG